jgi:hypothetical protein
MRFFKTQTNVVETDPILNRLTRVPVEDLTVLFKLYDPNGSVVTDSNVQLDHTSGGIYRKTVPVLASLATSDNYEVELDVKSGSVTVWYFRGPITILTRDSL